MGYIFSSVTVTGSTVYDIVTHCFIMRSLGTSFMHASSNQPYVSKQRTVIILILIVILPIVCLYFMHGILIIKTYIH